MSLRHLIAAVVAWSCLPSVTNAEIRYVVTNLGGLGGRWTQPFAINEGGQVAGMSFTAGGLNHAYLYDGSAMIDLISPGQPGTYPTGAGYGLNDTGQVVGYFELDWGQPQHAFLRSAPGEITDLGTLGGPASHARGVNNKGEVVGDAMIGNNFTHPFLWTAACGMIDLAPSAGNSWPYAINDHTQVVGDTGTVDGFDRAFIWSPSTGLVTLGTLGGSHSGAKGINNVGQVVGWSSTSYGNGDEQSHGFLYDPVAGMTDLGTLGGGDSVAYGINDNGWVVGGSGIPPTVDDPERAFVYDGTTMWNLNDLIDPSLGYTLYYAYDINNSGQIVVEAANPDRAVCALLLTPIPEPMTGCAIPFGAVAALATGRRRTAGERGTLMPTASAA